MFTKLQVYFLAFISHALLTILFFAKKFRMILYFKILINTDKMLVMCVNKHVRNSICILMLYDNSNYTFKISEKKERRDI